MTGPTREEVERLAPYAVDGGCDAYGQMEHDPFGDYVSFEAYEALRDRAEAAEARSYALAVAIMGGENAPGYADSVPTQDLVDQQRSMAVEWLHAVSSDEARAEIERLTKERDALAAAAFEAATRALEARKYGDPDERAEYAFDAALDRGIVAIRLLTPTDATAALQAVKDAGWNAAIHAASNDLDANAGKHTEKYGPALLRAYAARIRALRRNPKGGAA